MSLSILIVEDEAIKLATLEDILQRNGYSTITCSNGSEASRLIAQRAFDLALLDLKLPGKDGITLLREIKTHRPDTYVIMMTAFGSVETAVEAMRLGAYDFLTKPFFNEELLLRVEKIKGVIELERQNLRLQQMVESDLERHGIIGGSQAMKKVLSLVETVAPTETTVLIQGESGTGKEMIARAIQKLSPFRSKPFIRFSCAALPATLLEAELFGFEKGAFTGAAQRRPGRFERADGGTIFLDDIDDLDPALQVKLLRVLQEREFERVGGTATLKVKVRVLAATKVDLGEKVREGTFRQDLYYRLNIFPLTIPPLRERTEDIPLLAQHFLAKHAGATGKSNMEISTEALEFLSRRPWPGNIRELENVIERAMILCDSHRITLDHLQGNGRGGGREMGGEPGGPAPGVLPLREAVESLERSLIFRAMEQTGQNKTEAAKLLGIPRTTLNDRLAKMGEPQNEVIPPGNEG